MKEDLLKIFKHYGELPQLKHFNSEVFELNEAIINYETINNYDKEESNFKIYGNRLLIEHITEEIADVLVMLSQFIEYYKIHPNDILMTMAQKINRQLKRIEEEVK